MKSSSLEKYFKICSYLLVGQGFLTLCLTGSVDVFSMLLYPIALILSWYSDKPNSKLQIQPSLANKLALSFLPFVFIDFRYISSSYVGPLIHYSLFISIFNLFKIKADRDWVFLYLISVFEVLLAATLTIDFTFIIMLAIFLMLVLATLEAFEIKRSKGEVYQPKEERLLSQLGRVLPLHRISYLVGVTVVMVFLIGLITTPIFLLIPRFNTNFMARSFGASTVTITGFSEIVELGQVGSIKQSEQVVMNVKLKSDATKLKVAPKWRGVTLSQYNGRGWSEPRRELRRSVRLTDGIYKIDEPSKNPQIVEQTFYLEPLSSSVIFVAPRPLTISNQLPVLYRNAADSFNTSDHSYKQIVYTAYSDFSVPSMEELKTDEQAYSQEIRDVYLQMPDMDERVAKLAKDITKNATTRIEKAKAIEKYLKGNYGYSLDMKRTSEGDPLVDFLFNVRTGHCEYFASSMVILLRNVGVAARVVNGFQSGEYNELNNTFTVRQSEAHSWVEVYFPKANRWVEFDPTPAAGFSQYTNNMLNKVNKYFSALRMLWLDYVVTYDSDRQSYLSSRVKDTVGSYKLSLQNGILNFRQYLLTTYSNFSFEKLSIQKIAPAIILISLVSLAFITWYFRQLMSNWQLAPGKLFSSWWGQLFLPVLRWRTRGNPQQSAVLFYNEMLALLERKGFKKKPYQTPLEFATETKLTEVAKITNFYNSVRFSSNILNDENQQEIRKLIKEISKKKLSVPKPVSKPKRLVLATSVSFVVLGLLVSSIYFYNEQKLIQNSQLARRQLISFNFENTRMPKLIDKIIYKLRTEPGNGAEDLALAFAPGQSAEISPKGRLPWDDYFEPATQPTKNELELLFQRPEIALLEKAACRKDFDTLAVGNISEQQKNFLNKLDYNLVIDRVDILLWKAYVALREGREKDSEHTLAIIVSLGDRLRKDYSVNNASLGYRIISRGALAIAKYRIVKERQQEAKEMFELAKSAYDRRSKILYIANQIQLAGISDENLGDLFSLAVRKDEPALAQLAVTTIGTGWLKNPNQVVIGVSKKRKLFLAALSDIKNSTNKTSAAKYLSEATTMTFSERWGRFRDAYLQNR
jgi:hypothetical protein